MNSESKVRTWVQGVAAGFLCLTVAVTFAMAGGHRAPQEPAPSVSKWVPPSMHEAEAGVDVGPGSDEALLVSSPSAE